MTITQNIAYIKSHPYYALARTDESAMDKLLFEVMFHTYTVVAGNCARAFRCSKGMNTPQIVEAIREVAPPSNLDIRLPIPPPIEVIPVCVVTELPRTQVKKAKIDCMQLSLWA